MIKVKLHSALGPVLILGLTDGNLAEIRNGNPVRVDGAEVGIVNLTVLVMAGETRADLFDQLRRLGLLSAGVAAQLAAADDGQGN